MEKFVFAKIELWLVGLLVVLGSLLTLLFGALALKVEREGQSVGVLGDAAHRIAEMPIEAREALRGDDTRVALKTGKLEDRSGWQFADGATSLPDEDYLLLSRYDGTLDSAVVELVDLRDLTVEHRWIPDADILFRGVDSNPVYDDLWNREYFEAVHPFLLPDGGLLVKSHHTPLFRTDACARPVWSEESQIYHHSINADAQGNVWIPVHVQSPKPEYPEDFVEDGLAQLTTDGDILQIQSLVEIFDSNDMTAQMFGAGMYDPDPLHLNDIEPVLSDGPFWRKGDLFLSLRRTSEVVLYRPSTGKIIWYKQGPWLGQHDVDILDNRRISIFNNNAVNRGKGPVFDAPNEVLIYDFSTDTVSSPVQKPMADLQIKTHSEGLDDATSAGNLVIEEENNGRLVILAADGSLLAEFVNRADDGRVFTMGWSRVIDREQGDSVLAAIKAGPPCPAQ